MSWEGKTAASAAAGIATRFGSAGQGHVTAGSRKLTGVTLSGPGHHVLTIPRRLQGARAYFQLRSPIMSAYP